MAVLALPILVCTPTTRLGIKNWHSNLPVGGNPRRAVDHVTVPFLEVNRGFIDDSVDGQHRANGKLQLFQPLNHRIDDSSS